MSSISSRLTVLAALTLSFAACSKSVTAPSFTSAAGVYTGRYEGVNQTFYIVTATLSQPTSSWHIVLNDDFHNHYGEIVGTSFAIGDGTFDGSTFDFTFPPPASLSSFTGTVTPDFRQMVAVINGGDTVTLKHKS